MRSARWYARGALLAYAAAVLLAALVLLAQPLLTGLVGAALVAALGVATLQAVVITGPRRLVVLLLAGVLALAVAVDLVLADAWAAAVLVPALAGVGAWLHDRWRRSRVHATLPEPPKGSVATGRAVLVVNPRSGGGTAERVGLVERAREVGVDVLLLDDGTGRGDGDDPVSLARQAAERGATVLGVAGGDGSLGAVAEVAMAHDLPLVVVPAGTRNHLAQDLGLDRDDPLAALAAFTDPEERRIDVGCVNERTFLNNCSLGVYAALVDQEDYRDAKLATLLEALPAMWVEGGPWFDLRFDVPGHGRVEEAVLLQVSNNAYALEGDVFRRAVLDDGCLGLLAVDPDHLHELLALTALTAAGRPETSSVLWSWTDDHLEVASDQEVVVIGVDGERVELEPPLRFSMRPGALRLHVPEGTSVGLAEQVPEPRPHVDLLTAALGLQGPDE